MTDRVRWTCPGCQKTYAVPDTEGLTLCPQCLASQLPVMSEPVAASMRRKVSGAWGLKFRALFLALTILGIGTIGMLFGRRLVSGVLPAFNPTTLIDPDKALVEKRLKENLNEKPAAKDAAKEPAAIPEKVREYFQRADEAREYLAKLYESDINAFAIEIRGERSPLKKAELQRSLKKIENLLDELNKLVRNAHLSLSPKVDDMGVLESIKVLAVIDDDTFVGDVYRKITGATNPGAVQCVVVTGVDTKDIKTDDYIRNATIWRVTALESNSEVINRQASNKSSVAEVRYRNQPLRPLIGVKPVKNVEIEKYRAQYEAEKKKPAAAADKK